MSEREVQASVADRIELIEARASIEDLVHRYARCVRTGNAEDCANLFTQEATFEVREVNPGDPNSLRTRSTLQGRDAIVNYLNHGGAGGGSVCPLISNLLIQVAGREATSNCVMTALVWASGQSIVGEYLDTYRYDNGWRFTSRIYTIFRARS
jgi:hypothetical protein